jgi:hypothetical protein
MGYYTPNIPGTNEKLETAMRAEMVEREIQCPQLERTLHLAANLIEVSYFFPCRYNLFLVFELHVAGISRVHVRREDTYCNVQLVN